MSEGIWHITQTLSREANNGGREGKLYACYTRDGLEAWTASEVGAESFNHADAVAELQKRLDGGYYLRGWTLNLVKAVDRFPSVGGYEYR